MFSPIYKWIIYCFPKFQGFLVYFGHKSYGIHLLKMPPFHKISCIVLLLTISWLYLCAAFMWLCVLVLFQSWSLPLQSVSKSGITSPLTLFFGSSPCHLSGLLFWTVFNISQAIKIKFGSLCTDFKLIVCCLVALIKYPDRRNLRENGLFSSLLQVIIRGVREVTEAGPWKTWTQAVSIRRGQ